MRAGELRPDDPIEIAFELSALSHGLIVLYLGGRVAQSEKSSVRFTSVPSGDTSMAFVDKRPILLATLAVLSTAALLLAGNGMNPLWPLMWVAFIPVLLLAAETTSWRVAAGAAAAIHASGQSHHAVLPAFRAACSCDGVVDSVFDRLAALRRRCPSVPWPPPSWGSLQRYASRCPRSGRSANIWPALCRRTAPPAAWPTRKSGFCPSCKSLPSLARGALPSCCCCFRRPLPAGCISGAGGSGRQRPSWDRR